MAGCDDGLCVLILKRFVNAGLRIQTIFVTFENVLFFKWSAFSVLYFSLRENFLPHKDTTDPSANVTNSDSPHLETHGFYWTVTIQKKTKNKTKRKNDRLIIQFHPRCCIHCLTPVLILMLEFGSSFLTLESIGDKTTTITGLLIDLLSIFYLWPGL